MSINLRFTEEDWSRIQRDWSAWWRGELDRPLVLIETSMLADGKDAPHAFLSNYPLTMSEDDVLDRYQAGLENRRFHGDAFPKWWPNFGPGIVAGFLGAQVHSVPETVWFEPKSPVEISELRLLYDAKNIWWRRIRKLTARAAERWGRQVAVAHTDLGGNLDILASFRTTEGLLFDSADNCTEVERLVYEINQLWIRYYDELDAIIRPSCRGTTPWAPIWSSGRCYMLQSDFAYMISPEMFERFVLPDLASCCDILDHGFYHLDGKGQIPHLDMLLSLERLAGIQWIPGDGAPPPEDWLPLLKRIRDAGKLCQLYVSAQGALKITRELGGKGFVFSISDSMSPQEAEDLAALLRR